MKGKFELRFTGKETRKFCHNFMYLTQCLYNPQSPENPNEKPLDHIKRIAFTIVGTEIRNATSLFSRVEVTQADIHELKSRCTSYFNAYYLFVRDITPTIWTVAHAIPYHTQLIFDKFKLGLGMNTMQGREAKHISIRSFAKHSSLTNRWDLVFHHEFVSLIRMREHDPLSDNYKCTDVKYIPEQISTPEFCFCGLPKITTDDNCMFCSHPLFKEVKASIRDGDYTDCIRQILGTNA